VDAETAGGAPAEAAAGGGLKALRATVEAVAESLISPTPDTLERTAKQLGAATVRLVEIRQRLQATGGGPEEYEELRRLRLALGRAAALLEKARNFHAAWESYLAARAGGYRAGCQPAPLLRPGRFSLEA
jgi:hypothetical protein